MTPERYSRQARFNGIGEQGQAALSRARVVIVGCGGLGSFQSEMIVRAGVGHVRLIDRDIIEESNLQRQVLYAEADVRERLPKALAAERRLRQVNSEVRIEALVEELNPSSAKRLLGGFDLVLDATDNFPARFLVNDFAVKHAVPWIYGACVASGGSMFTILPGQTACLQCLYEDVPPAGVAQTCHMVGVISPAVGMVACLQVAEALKLLSGNPGRVNRSYRSFDLWGNQFTQTPLPGPDPECPCCGRRTFTYLDRA